LVEKFPKKYGLTIKNSNYINTVKKQKLYNTAPLVFSNLRRLWIFIGQILYNYRQIIKN